MNGENTMTIEDIQNIVKAIIREKLLIDCDIENNDILVESGLDSVKMIKLVVELENYFSFEFEDDKLSYDVLRNINEISKYVYKRLSESLFF